MSVTVRITKQCRHPVGSVVRLPDRYGLALVRRGYGALVDQVERQEEVLELEQQEQEQDAQEPEQDQDVKEPEQGQDAKEPERGQDTSAKRGSRKRGKR